MIDTEWLTQVLGEQVTSVEVRASDAFNSATVFAQVTYQDAGSGLPTRLVVKRPSEADWSRAAAVAEAGFYRYVGTLPDHPPVLPRCLAAADEYLVLADLSPTHSAPVTRAASIALDGVPTMDALESAVDALAALHAYWWGRDPGPFEVATWWGDERRFEAYAGRRRRSWERIAAEVPPPARAVYDLVFAGLDRFGERLRDHDGPLTLVHGDAYLSNFLVPTSGLGVLLDWQSPSVDIGALDLANMCATFWTREQRRGYEELVLRRYHTGLNRTDYPYGQLLSDYRIAVADWLLVPVQDAADGSRRDYWWPKMSCLLDAFADHGGAELFG